MSAPRTHVLTGGGSGIGLFLARRLVERGDRVVLLARSEARADELSADVPGAAAVVVADLADPAGLARIAESLVSGRPALDRVDSLLHLAGVVDLEPVAELDLDRWQQQLAVNLTAPAVLTRALLPALRTARGHVVFVNSGAGLSAHAQWSGYAASKHGLRALADALRAEEAAHGVRVTSVYPGRTATPMQAKVHAQEGKDYDPDRWIAPDSVAATVLHCLDLPADAEVTDVTVRPGPG